MSAEARSFLADARAYLKAARTADDNRERARCADRAITAAENAIASAPGSHTARAAARVISDAQTMMGR